DSLSALQEEFPALLPAESASRFRNALREGQERRHFLARQPLLAAMRTVVTMPQEAPEEPSALPRFAAAVYSHAIARTLASQPEDGSRIAGIPEGLFFEILRLGLLGESEDMWSTIDRAVRLWTHFGVDLEDVQLRESPAVLLQEATGLELLEILGLGFGIF